MKNSLVILIFTLTFGLYTTFGCSLKQVPFEDFDTSEYIFIGEVTGYTQPLRFDQKKRKSRNSSASDYDIKFAQANGLIVKVKEAVRLPKTPKSHFEVFPLQVGSICETLGYTEFEIKNRYPLNSEILVVAGAAKKFPHKIANGNFRLEEAETQNFIVSNTGNDDEKIGIVNRIYEYQKNRLAEDYKSDDLSVSKFEIRKDLLRLKQADKLSERREILNRISFYYKAYRVFDLYEVSRKYLSDPKEVNDLYRKHLLFSDFSEQDVEKEIMRRQKTDAVKN